MFYIILLLLISRKILYMGIFLDRILLLEFFLIDTSNSFFFQSQYTSILFMFMFI